jgi:hypothetical protein
MGSPPGPFAVEVDYAPAASGPFLWQAYDRGVVERDLDAIAGTGVRAVRVKLGWDSFMPDDSAVDRRRIAELNHLLRSALARSLRLTLVLFVWSAGDCLLLPAYTVLRRHPRRGVRVLCDGRVEPGGPRDVYTDPLMLELADRWLRTLLADVGGHPALDAIDLGGDPAATVRPRRIADLQRWVSVHAATVRSAGHQVRLTAGAGDVLAARGMRLDGLDVDRLDIAVTPAELGELELDRGDAILLVAALAGRLAGRALVAEVALSRDAEAGAPDDRAAIVDELCARREEAGLAGLRAGAWHDLAETLERRPPFDRRDWLRRCGVSGSDTAAALGHLSRRDLGAAPPSTWPPELAAEDHYRHLEDSRRDLAARWRRDRSGGGEAAGRP